MKANTKNFLVFKTRNEVVRMLLKWSGEYKPNKTREEEIS